MKCAWHGIENCPVSRTEDAVREFSHQHDEGVCKPECYGCFIIREAKADVDAVLVQNGELKAELERVTDLGKGVHATMMELADEVKRKDRLNQVLQNRMAEIVKVASKPGSLFPKSMAEMNPVEGKIAIVACELSGDLSYIKGLAESPITENRKPECPHLTFEPGGICADCKKAV